MPPTESKSYDPASIEKSIFDLWMKGEYFVAKPDERPPEKRFCMVIPPPNVTGALHLGHALNNTLQDILVRHKRMAGFNTFWLVGTDHAGIATQATVEKTIRKDEGKSRHDLGREELVKRIWEWKAKFGSRIVEQLRLMGCSCDYSRERFTLDEGCAKAVRETFFKLFRDGLIYRGKRLVNWDTQLQTAVADDEVYHETVKGHFYHFKYPLVHGAQPPSAVIDEPTHVHIATTRPETMLADTAVAVHPDPAAAMEKRAAELRTKLKEASEKDRADVQAAIDDLAECQKSLLPTLLKLRDMANAGRKIMLPLMNREIPLICDEWADPTLGTGCVKITPAHDANDYEVGQRRKLPMINVMTPDGRVSPEGGKYAGQKFAEARKNVVADMEALGLVEKIEDRMIDLGHSDRSQSPIEPYLSDQWFVKMGDLTAEEFARIQTPELKAAISRAQSEPRVQTEPRPLGSGFELTGKNPLADARGSEKSFPGLAEIAIHAVRRGDVKIHPERYAKTYSDWLGEKRDWCISRQLWWGHRIPVWNLSLKMGTGDAAERLRQYAIESQLKSDDPNDPEDWPLSDCATQLYDDPATGEWTWHMCPPPGKRDVEIALSRDRNLEQDPDVLDTWFSSALWPHSTLGWPDSRSDEWIADTEPRPLGSGFSDVVANPLPNGRGSDLLQYFYPTSVLSTAREIITLWVARMVITGLYNMGDVPFKDVVIHSVIQDGQGKKMSKTAGNGVDPVDIIEEYGADALRFTLADQATETQDIRLPVKPKKLPDGRTINISERFEKGRNFCNKLWQAATGFVMRNLEGYQPKPLDPATLRLEDRWILSRMTACLETLNGALENYRFSEAAASVYRFMWDEYCSWYIEMVKSRLANPLPQSDLNTQSEPRPSGSGFSGVVANPLPHGRGSDLGRGTEIDAGKDRATAQQVLIFVLDQLLRMLHPFMPFVTEAIWQELNKDGAAQRRGLTKIVDAARDEKALVAAAWPVPDASLRNLQIESDMERLHALIKSVRDIRADVNDHRGKAKQPSVRSLARVVVRADAAGSSLIDRYRNFVMPLAGCDALEVGAGSSKPKGSMSRVSAGIEVYAPVAEYVDLAEVKRAEALKLDELRGLLAREQARTANADFVKRADPAVVEQSRQRAAELSSRIHLIEQHLAELS